MIGAKARPLHTASVASTRRDLSLPRFDIPNVAAGRIVHHAVTITLAVFFILAAVAAAASYLVVLDVTVAASGELEPAFVSAVRAPETGIVASVLVATGDTVAAGQVLARLDTESVAQSEQELAAEIAAQVADTERTWASADVDRAESRTQAEQATAHIVRARAALVQHLVDFGLARRLDSVLQHAGDGMNVTIDQFAADVMSGNAELHAAQVQASRADLATLDLRKQRAVLAGMVTKLHAAVRQRRRLTIVAPVRGVVLTDQIDRLVGSNVHQGDPVIELGGTKAWRATLMAGESDVQKMRIGNVAHLDVPALGATGGGALRGRISQIGMETLTTDPAASPFQEGASGESSAGRYRVLVDVDASQLDSLGLTNIKRGYSVQAKVSTRSVRAARLMLEHVLGATSDRRGP